MRSVRFLGLFLSLLALMVTGLGCSAQSASQTEQDRRMERLVRAHFRIPATVEIKPGSRHASEFPGYDVLPITLTRGDKSSTHEFLISKDGKKLIQMVPIEDPTEKIDLAGRPSRGAADAKVVVVNYDDFQCPYCARNHQTLFTDIIKSYGDRVRIVYKDYPLAEIHPWATRAAIDANCLAEQSNDAYWDFADYVHLNQREISGPPPPAPDNSKPAKPAAPPRSLAEQFVALDRAAEDAGRKRNVDAGKLAACIKAQPDAAVRASIKEADALGVSATPTMFINGQKLDGAAPPEQLRAALDRALVEAGAAPASKPDSKAAPSQ